MTTKTLHPAVRIPKKLADAFDTYFQTSSFAQQNFLKFNKDMLLEILAARAERYGYELDLEAAKSDKFKGVFKLSHKKRDVRIGRKNLPFAEDWTVAGTK